MRGCAWCDGNGCEACSGDAMLALDADAMPDTTAEGDALPAEVYATHETDQDIARAVEQERARW